MLSHLSLSVCLITISVQPPTPDAETAPSPILAAAPAGFGAGNYGSAPFTELLEGDDCPQCGHRHHSHTPFHDWTCPPCNLTQRYPYYPKDHGHYYFRPYHMQRVLEHQAQAVAWGEDPRNPHGQLVFERVYEQIRAEQASKAEPLPLLQGSTPMPPTAESAKDPMLPMPAPVPPAPKNDASKKNEQSSTPKPINILRK